MRSAAQDLGKCLQCGRDNDYPLAAVCTSCQKKNVLLWPEQIAQEALRDAT